MKCVPLCASVWVVIQTSYWERSVFPRISESSSYVQSCCSRDYSKTSLPIRIKCSPMVIKTWTGSSRGSGAEWKVYLGDALDVMKKLPSDHFDCAITSPPYYWLRDYGVEGQIGHEETVIDYVKIIADVMDEVHRTLKDQGLLFLNIGDTYYSGKGKSHGVDPKSTKRRFGLRAVDKSGGVGIGIRPKSIIGIPWRVAMEMSKRKWVLRSAIIWHRKHALTESVLDRPRRSYENIFMCAKDPIFLQSTSVERCSGGRGCLDDPRSPQSDQRN